MKKKIIIVLACILLPVLLWGASYLYCEVITALYGDAVYQQIADRIGIPGWETETFKLLSYWKDRSTRIYYISANPEMGYRDGCTVTLEWKDGRWEFTDRGIRGWSNSGSADDPIWPYALLPPG